MDLESLKLSEVVGGPGKMFILEVPVCYLEPTLDDANSLLHVKKYLNGAECVVLPPGVKLSELSPEKMAAVLRSWAESAPEAFRAAMEAAFPAVAVTSAWEAPPELSATDALAAALTEKLAKKHGSGIRVWFEDATPENPPPVELRSGDCARTIYPQLRDGVVVDFQATKRYVRRTPEGVLEEADDRAGPWTPMPVAEPLAEAESPRYRFRKVSSVTCSWTNGGALPPAYAEAGKSPFVSLACPAGHDARMASEVGDAVKVDLEVDVSPHTDFKTGGGLPADTYSWRDPRTGQTGYICARGHDAKRAAGPCRDSYCFCSCAACRRDKGEG